MDLAAQLGRKGGRGVALFRNQGGRAPRARGVHPAGRLARSRHAGDAGASIMEVLVVLVLLAVVLQLAAPSFARWRAQQELEAAVRNIGLALARACAHAVASGRYHGLAFNPDAGALSWHTVADGDGDGISAADVRSGVDWPLDALWVLSAHHPGVRAGRPAGVPPVAGGAPGTGGLAFGRSAIISCSPSSAARSGTLYLRSGRGNAAALRVYGPSARITTWWWDVELLEWVRIR